MGKKYLDTKRGTLESSVLGVWKEQNDFQETVMDVWEAAAEQGIFEKKVDPFGGIGVPKGSKPQSVDPFGGIGMPKKPKPQAGTGDHHPSAKPKPKPQVGTGDHHPPAKTKPKKADKSKQDKDDRHELEKWEDDIYGGQQENYQDFKVQSMREALEIIREKND